MVLVATQVKRRRGTTAENDAFTGAEGEIVVDTQKHTLRVHDGETQGGFEIAKQADLNNKADTTYVNSQLGLKANTNLSNVSGNIDYVVESQEPTSANGYTWFRKYKSGWVEQGGRTSNFTNTSSGESKNVSLPVAMASTGYTVKISKGIDTTLGNGSVTGYSFRDIIVSNITSTTSFIIDQWCNQTAQGTSVIAYWQVSGMSA